MTHPVFLFYAKILAPAVLEHLRPIVSSINTLIGNCENMEATYCVGNDVDVCRMFDQYLYKVGKYSFILLLVLLQRQYASYLVKQSPKIDREQRDS